MAGRVDLRIERGNQTRQTILKRSTQIASVEGLDGLSLGRLAGELRLSKSGVFALFGSIEDLQLATIRAAVKVYVEHVLQPSRALPPGAGKVWQLCRSWLEYSRTRVFAGGCFFCAVSAEFDARPGPIHDAVAAANDTWVGYVETTIGEAIAAGQIAAGTDRSLLAFELIALLEAANARSVLHNDESLYRTAGTAILHRLRAAATDPTLVPATP
jgi:AcrR family transcriptional regulator